MNKARTLTTVISTALLIATTNVSPAKADWGDFLKDIFQPAREIADPYFDNVWFASLYPEVKQDIDNNHSGGNRTNEYFRICRLIAVNQGIVDANSLNVPIYSDISSYIFNRVALAVREENGVVNCYHRTLN